jgi:hypothetical protein
MKRFGFLHRKWFPHIAAGFGLAIGIGAIGSGGSGYHAGFSPPGSEDTGYSDADWVKAVQNKAGYWSGPTPVDRGVTMPNGKQELLNAPMREHLEKLAKADPTCPVPTIEDPRKNLAPPKGATAAAGGAQTPSGQSPGGPQAPAANANGSLNANAGSGGGSVSPVTNNFISPTVNESYGGGGGGLTGGLSAPAQTAASRTLRDEIQSITTNVAGNSVYDAARGKANEVTQKASADYSTLTDNVAKLPGRAKAETFFQQANDYLRQSIDTFKQATTDLPAGNHTPFMMNLRKAEEKSAAGLSLIQEEKEKSQGPTIGSLGLFRTPASLPMNAGGGGAVNTPLMDLFDQQAALSNPISTDALADRNIMLAGLSPAERANVAKSLKLVELVHLTLPDGRKTTLPLLHNGYILGNAKTGLDCSSLVSAALSPVMRQNNFTTLDFRMMWLLRKFGIFPKPPTYDTKREKEVRRASQAFDPIDIDKGESLAKGDLLIYRTSFEAAGHVVLVQNYDPKTMRVGILESAQSAGSVRERDFYLEAFPGTHVPKAGFMALRLKPTDNKGCRFRDIAGVAR